LIGEDPLARQGLALLLAPQQGLDVVAQSDGGEELDALLSESRADVVLWDLGFAIPALPEKLRSFPIPVVALLPDERGARDALEAGVSGTLLRDLEASRLGAALRAAAEGLVVWDSGLGGPPSRLPAQPSLLEELTPRETEVLQLLAQGLPNREIATKLGISDHTAKFHVNSILGKLGAETRTEAVVLAARLGLVVL